MGKSNPLAPILSPSSASSMRPARTTFQGQTKLTSSRGHQPQSQTRSSPRLRTLRHNPSRPSTNVSAERLLGVFERRQHLEPVLCPARQHDLVVLELEAVVTDDHHVGAHAEESTDREHYIRLLAVTRHQEVVNLADRFVRTVEDAVTDDLGRPIAGRHLLHIDLGDLYRLWNALRSRGARQKGYAHH